jgi:hypothetical protein
MHTTTWGASVTTGSPCIFVWQSKDLIKWTDERLLRVESDAAGMVWAPSAVTQGSTIHVFWSSRFFAENDPSHKGPATKYVIRTAQTTNFRTFTTPTTYAVDKESNLIDQELLQLHDDNWIRIVNKNDTGGIGRNYLQSSTSGLFGEWTKGKHVTTEKTAAEGAALYRDNLDPDLLHMAQDNYMTDHGYILYQKRVSLLDTAAPWTRSTNQSYPKANKHGSFISLTQDQYTLLDKYYVR